MRNETSRDVTCDCTYEAVGVEDGLARPVFAQSCMDRPNEGIAEAGENEMPIRMNCSGGTSVIKDLGCGVVGNGCSRITTWPNERIPRTVEDA